MSSGISQLARTSLQADFQRHQQMEGKKITVNHWRPTSAWIPSACWLVLWLFQSEELHDNAK